MAVGRLASLKTGIGTGVGSNTTLYLATEKLSDVTINIVNQGFEKSLYSVGISSGTLSGITTSDYVADNVYIEPRETQTINVGIKSGDLIFCKSSKPNIGFVAFSTYDYSSGLSTYYGREQGVSITPNTINTNLSVFTSHRSTKAELYVYNFGVEKANISFGLSLGDENYFTDSDYLIYAKILNPKETYVVKDIVVGDNQSIIVRSSKSNVSFSVNTVPADPTETISASPSSGGGEPPLIIDDISAGFNGVTTSFSLTKNSGISSYYPASAYKILVSLNGVVQEPVESYTITSNVIGFSSAPQSGDQFFAVDISSSSSGGGGGGGVVSYNDIVNKPFLSPVVSTGSYNDLVDKPTIPAAQVNPNWSATTGISSILNKPTIPVYISDLADVSGTTPASNTKVLKWDGTKWEPSDVTLVSPGKTYYVSTNGSNSNPGNNINEPFATLAYALNSATSGDIINLAAGTYTETCPLTVPSGVTVKGAGLRATTIKPSGTTRTKNIFLLNNSSTIEDLTVQDVYYDSTNDTGYAFSYAYDAEITTRSPYIQRVTVLNKGSSTSLSDPYGYDTADSPPTYYTAGRGAKVDGSFVKSTSLEAGMLFNEVTFITPNNKGIVITNGARVEYINCYHYFASQAIVGTSGTVGVGSTANARLKLVGLSVSPTQNQVIKLYENNSPVAVGTVRSFSDPYLTINGKGYGAFTSVGIGTTQDVRVFDTDGVTQVGTAGTISLADYKMFGAEIRSIGCAVEYGSQGVVADGLGVNLRLFALNFNHVGTGKDFTNDPTITVQANEVVELNNGQVSYVSIDQSGDFRVGESLYINQETGNVSFASTTYDVTALGNLTVSDGGSNTTTITPTSLTVANLQLASNILSSTSGDINIDPSGSNKTSVTGNLHVSGIVTSSVLAVSGVSTASDVRLYSVAEKLLRVASGNSVDIIYGNGSSSNIGICASPTGDIAVRVSRIPEDSSFDNSVITFSVFVVQTGTARSCTSVTLNGVSRTIKWTGGSLASAISGVTTNRNGVDIYNFIGINTVGSASTANNYLVLGSVNGGFV